MSYKTILVHVDRFPMCAERVRIAASLALVEQAHVIGVASTSLPSFLFTGSALDPKAPPLTSRIDLLRKDAGQALEAFERQLQALGVSSFESRLVDDEAGVALSLHARYCDVAVLGGATEGADQLRVRPGLVEYVLLKCARPVLLVPVGAQFAALGERVLLAWDGGMAASRAVASAIPLLQRARQVEVLVCEERNEGGDDELPDLDIGRYLARHGIAVQVRQRVAGSDAGHAVLAAARDGGADLIVMGAYGHARLRELLLGGVTRTVLAALPLPLWLAH